MLFRCHFLSFVITHPLYIFFIVKRPLANEARYALDFFKHGQQQVLEQFNTLKAGESFAAVDGATYLFFSIFIFQAFANNWPFLFRFVAEFNSVLSVIATDLNGS
jgi:hypothetical protein